MFLHAAEEAVKSIRVPKHVLIHASPSDDGLAYKELADAQLAAGGTEIVAQIHDTSHYLHAEDFYFVVGGIEEFIHHVDNSVFLLGGEALKEVDVEAVVEFHHLVVVVAFFLSEIDFGKVFVGVYLHDVEHYIREK